MAQATKFTSFGIPHVLDFENVSFVPDSRPKHPGRHPHEDPRITTESPFSERSHYSSSPSLSSSTSSFCLIEMPIPVPRFPSFSLRSASSLFKRKPTQPSSDAHSPTNSSQSSSASSTVPPFMCAISEDTKPLPSPPHPDILDMHAIYIQFSREHSIPRMSRKDKLLHLQQTISVAVLEAGMDGSPGNTTNPDKSVRTADALFCGTYGQLMAALEGAGLSATPCLGEGLSGYTRLGALFVAPKDGASGLQLRKITLWG